MKLHLQLLFIRVAFFAVSVPLTVFSSLTWRLEKVRAPLKTKFYELRSKNEQP
jgi:hypothetical protein